MQWKQAVQLVADYHQTFDINGVAVTLPTVISHFLLLHFYLSLSRFRIVHLVNAGRKIIAKVGASALSPVQSARDHLKMIIILLYIFSRLRYLATARSTRWQNYIE